MEWTEDPHLSFFNQQFFGQSFLKNPFPQFTIDVTWTLNSPEIFSFAEPQIHFPRIQESREVLPPVPLNSEVMNRPIRMFSGTDFSLEITDKDRINKDLMFTLVIQDPSFKLKNSSANVNINSNIYYHGNRKKNQPKIDNCDYKLNGMIVDSSNSEVGICPSCGKKDKLNLRVRSADIATEGEYAGSMVVKGSVTCSGDPPNCSKALRIKMWVGELQSVHAFKGKGGSSQIVERVICEGESPPFFLLHHRRKNEAEISCKSRKRSSCESSDEDSPKAKKSSKSTSMKQVQEKNVSTNNIVNHCSTFLSLENLSDFYDSQIIHNGMKIMNTILEQSPYHIPSFCQLKFLELCLSLAGFIDCQWDLEVTCKGNDQIYLKKTEFYLDKIVTHLSQSLERTIPSIPSSKDIMNFIWRILCTQESTMRSYCSCEDCISSHLAFILNASICRGTKLEVLVKDLINFKIPQTFWNFHLDNKSKHFNWRIFTSDSPIGRFSRLYYPPSLVKDLILRSHNVMEENLKRPQFVQNMTIAFPIETYFIRHQLAVQLSTSLIKIIEGNQSLIDIPINIDDYSICT